jgi:hypothetical protein
VDLRVQLHWKLSIITIDKPSARHRILTPSTLAWARQSTSKGQSIATA